MERPNLARQPFLDTRPVWLAGIVLTAIALGLTVASLAELFSARSREKATAERLASLQARSEKLRSEVGAASRRLSEVSWKKLDGEVGSLGSVLARRRLSWSILLSDLERLVPWNVRLLSISPAVDEKGVVTVLLTGVAADRASWLELVARCFSSDRFSDPRPSNEEAPGSTNAQGYKFTLLVRYWPEGKS